jgi:asparagine synthase (glutamine-hydrolysing)
MCGISAIINPQASDPALLSRLARMHGVIAHRGPDGEGFLAVGAGHETTRSERLQTLANVGPVRVGLAFRRLSICDLSALAAQPMASADRSLWLMFNGEIYNFRKLRRELEALGRRFKTHGDTEVVLQAYAQWGSACFARMHGMWALCLVDLARQRVLLSRDRFGIKPLYYASDATGGLLIASEIKQILAAGQVAIEANRPLIEMYLRGQRYPAIEETFFAGIRPMPPATWCEFPLNTPLAPLEFRPYWSLGDFRAGTRRPNYADALHHTGQLLDQAVASHRVADVPVNALLSGGLDSSTIVALARQQGAPSLATYSLGYRETAPEFCEMPYVEALTRRDGIRNHETTLDAAWVAAHVDDVLSALEEPPLAMPAFAQYRMFQFCAEHGERVLLDGQGADEVTAGYQYHQRAFIRDRLVTRRFGAMARELRAMARHDGRHASGIFFDMFVRPRLQSRPAYPWIVPSAPRADAAAFAAARADRGGDSSDVNRQLYFDVRWGNLKIVLGYGDRSAMAHSIESRVPYLDTAFVEWMFSLPDDYKIGGGERKRLQRDVARQWLPPMITDRVDRMGYGTPDAQMIRHDLWPDIRASVLDPGFAAHGWVERTAVERFLGDFHAGRHNDYRAIWRLWMLSRWASRFLTGDQRAS